MSVSKFNQNLFNSVPYNGRRTIVSANWPDIICRVALNDNALEISPAWRNLSDRVISLSIKRGRQHQLDRVEAGTATLILKNIDGELWPDNASGHYYPNVLPGKRINIRAQWGLGTYDIFTGFIESWTPDWLGEPGTGAIMKLEASDAIKNLALFVIDDGTGYSSELTGTRIGNILDDYSWPSVWRDLADGKTTMPATGALANQNAMSHLHTLQESEYGTLFIDGSGDIVFMDRHTRLTDYDVSQAIFGDDSGEMIYYKPILSYDDTYIYNYVRIERDGGTAQTASDSTSQTAYGLRSLSKSDLLVENDNEALNQAEYLLNKYKDPHMRARTLIIYPARNSIDLFRKVLNYDIGTRITLRLNDASLDEDYHIEGIGHSIDFRQQKWSTTWQLGPVDSAFWQLGVSGASELGETTYVGY